MPVSFTTLIRSAGDTIKTVVVTINGDTTYELDETYVVDLSNASNATISDNQGVGTITNDDASPTFAIDDVSVTEGNAGTKTATFTVTKTGATEVTATVQAATANTTATAGSDYVAVSLTTLTFLSGDTTKTVVVTINGDTPYELDETYVVDLSNASNATISDNQGLGTITNDDTAPTFAIDDVTVTEGNAGTKTATFTVTKTGATEVTATVQAATANTTATAGSDYVAVSLTTLTFLTGDTTKTVVVTINGDTVYELDETYAVNLSNPSNATISDNQGLGTITNDDTAPTFAIDDVSVTEGKAGTKTATFTVTKTGATEVTATVQAANANITATAGSAYVAVSLTTLTFLSGDTTKTVAVTINGDTTYEADETYVVDLSNASNATISDNQGVGTITNDDASPTLAIDDVAVTEANAGTKTATSTVTYTGVTRATATVQAATANATATAGSDYVAVSLTTLTFLSGDTTKTVVVTINGDTTYELDETYVVNLSNPANATINDNQGVGTTTNDETRPTFAVSDETVS